jgi:hypothetical protein
MDNLGYTFLIISVVSEPSFTERKEGTKRNKDKHAPYNGTKLSPAEPI